MSYAEYDTGLCQVIREWTEEVDDLSCLEFATFAPDSCSLTTEVGAPSSREACCNGELLGSGSGDDPADAFPDYVLEFTTFDFGTCEVLNVSCEPVRECGDGPGDGYDIPGDSDCYTALTDNPLALAPMFPATLYLTWGTPHSGVARVAGAGLPAIIPLQDILDATGVPYRLPITHVGTGTGSAPRSGPLTKLWEFHASSNFDPGDGTPGAGSRISATSPGYSVRGLAWLNAEYEDPPGTGYNGCQAEYEVYYWPDSSATAYYGYDTSNSAGGFGSGGYTHAELQFYPEPVYIEYPHDRRFVTTMASNGTLVVSDYDVPPLATGTCLGYQIPATLTATISAAISLGGVSMAGTYTLTWQEGNWRTTFSKSGTDYELTWFASIGSDGSTDNSGYSGGAVVKATDPAVFQEFTKGSLTCSPLVWTSVGSFLVVEE